MIVLLIGPSGAGKSTVVRTVSSQLPDCTFGNLDDLASIRAVELKMIDRQCIHALCRHLADKQLLLAFGMQAIGKFAAEHAGSHVVIDVGAAFQNARSAENLGKIHPVIALTVAPEIGYQRFVDFREPRDREDYLRHEFSERRRRVYDSASFPIDTTNQSPEETAASFLRKLNEVFSNGTS